jgi:hypothetical protein
LHGTSWVRPSGAGRPRRTPPVDRFRCCPLVEGCRGSEMLLPNALMQLVRGISVVELRAGGRAGSRNVCRLLEHETLDEREVYDAAGIPRPAPEPVTV